MIDISNYLIVRMAYDKNSGFQEARVINFGLFLLSPI
jgi:hypothetical protein